MSTYNAPPPAESSSKSLIVVLVIVALMIPLGLAIVACGLGAFLLMQATPAKHEMVAESGRLPEIDSPEIAGPAVLPLQDRMKWVYAESPEGAGGMLSKTSDSAWSETRSDRVNYTFAEIARSSEFVELLDSSRGLFVRLYADHMEWRRDGQDWARGQNGAWSPSP